MFRNSKNEFVKEDNGQQSSMRKALLDIVDLTKVVGGTMCAVMLIQSLKGIPVDFQGASLFLAGLGAFVAPVFGFKAWQKGKEEKINK